MMTGTCPYASTMWFGGAGWWAPLLVVILAVALIAVLVALVASRRGRGDDPAIERLRMRLAAGEISEAEFDTARHALGA